MTLASVSQHDQVTALTRGTSLPLAPLGADVLEIILEAVAHAWAHVKATHPGHLETGNEAAISALLVSRLNETLGTDPLLGMLVACVDRGSENISFDGKKLEMRPDLQFALTALDKRFRLIGEAKIIDIPKKKTPSLYRTKGIARFVRGDYAWTSREAFMVGYVRCNAQLDADLLSGLTGFASLNCAGKALVSPVNPPIATGALGKSTHHRKFSYVHTHTASPGAIELWHLWLNASHATE